MTTARRLRRLEALRLEFGAAAADEKRALVNALARARFTRAADLERFHEALCFIAAYPDDGILLARVRRELRAFARRPDLARHRDALACSGIAGTATCYNFFWMMARWLALRMPGRLSFDRDAREFEARLTAALPQLLPWVKAEATRRSSLDPWALIERLKGRQTDAAFVLGRIATLPGDDFTREHFHDAIDAAYVLAPGDGFPSRTTARHERAPLVWRREAPPAARPDVARELARAPRSVRAVQGREARALVELAREAMLTRARDLVAFSWGDERDVLMVDDGDGLSFAIIGSLPERRLPLPVVHGWIMLRNRVPVGYVQTDTLLAGSELSFNVFPTFRGAEAGHLFARVLAVSHHVLGARAFSIEPYQLGEGNDEGIASGAWWFYYKLGFRPVAAAPQVLLAQELGRMRRDPSHRSGEAVLRALAKGHMVREPEAGVRAWLPLMPSLGISGRVRDEADATEKLLRALDARHDARWPADERMAFARLAPVVRAIHGISRWSAAEKRAAIAVMRAKGGRHELDFARALDGHPRLSEGLRRLLERSAGRS